MSANKKTVNITKNVKKINDKDHERTLSNMKKGKKQRNIKRKSLEKRFGATNKLQRQFLSTSFHETLAKNIFFYLLNEDKNLFFPSRSIHCVTEQPVIISYFKRKGIMRLVYSRTNTYHPLLIRPSTSESVLIVLIRIYTLIVQRKQKDDVSLKSTVVIFEICCLQLKIYNKS